LLFSGAKFKHLPPFTSKKVKLEHSWVIMALIQSKF